MQDIIGALGTQGIQYDEDEEIQTVPGALTMPKPIGHCGFVETMFNELMPLGLVLDWSMPFPVVAKVLPGSIASKRSQVKEGMVLIAINKSGLRIRPPRDEVEERLAARPLHIVLEAPAPERFDFFGTMRTWKRHLNKERAEPHSSLQNSMANTSQSFFGQGSRNSSSTHLVTSSLPDPSSNLAKSLNRVRSHPGILNGIDAMHGTKLPNLREIREPTKLPPVIRGGSTMPPLSGLGTKSRPRVASQSKTGMSWAGAASLAAVPLRQNISNKTLSWLGAGIPKPDTAYQHLIDEPRALGPGAPERWPLHHDDMYICRLSDMMLAWRLREAYEVGFRGFKHERPTQMHLTCAQGAPVLTKKVTRVDEVYCDMCGADVNVDKDDRDEFVDPLESLFKMAQEEAKAKPAAQQDEEQGPLPGALKESAGAFYFCRRCKRSSNRFELCAACHAIEVVQCEGKHHGKELHPHFLRCQHRSLVPRRFVNDSVPGMPHIRRVMCDYCGHLAGSYDNDNEIWVCQQCPELHGLRFELCTPCYTTLNTVSQGIDRLK
jgi:hypothetical protein